MKLIDENGRIFGKMNIIDLLVILFILSFLPVFFFGYKLTAGKQRLFQKKKEYIEVEIPCSILFLKKDTMDLIKIGDKSFDNDGVQLGEIVWIGQPHSQRRSFEVGVNDQITVEDPALETLPVKIRIKAEIRDNALYFREHRILVEQPFQFTTQNYNILVAPSSLEGKEDDMEWALVEIRFSGIFPQLKKLMKKGDIEKDKEGRIIAELREIIVSKPAEPPFETKLTKLPKSEADYYNLSLKLNILCIKKEGKIYFKKKQIEEGELITFSPSLYSISGLISDVRFEGY